MLLLISGLGDENTKLEFGQIYEKNYRTMYYVALKILKNKEEAEDAVHGAFVKLAEKYDTYRHLTSQEMTSLCVIIVKNKCLDMLRVSKSGLQSDLEKVDYALHDEKDQPLENVIEGGTVNASSWQGAGIGSGYGYAPGNQAMTADIVMNTATARLQRFWISAKRTWRFACIVPKRK